MSFVYAIYVSHFLCVCHLISWVRLPCTPLSPYGDCFEPILLLSASYNRAKCPSVHSLPYPIIHLRGYIKGIPLNAEVSSAWQTYDGASRVYITLYPPENGVQAQCNMQTDTHANPCIPDASQSSICQPTKILIPPWKLVLGGSGAASKWSRSIQTTLGCATCWAWCDHPR